MADDVVIELNARPFEIKRGDTRPKYMVQLKDDLDKPEEEQSLYALVGDETIFFLMSPKEAEEGAKPTLRAEGQIEDAPTSMVSYLWAEGDTDVEPGEYRVEFEVIDSEGGKETVPNKGFFTIIINPDLDEHP